MSEHIKITLKDWEAICAFVELGIADTITAEISSVKDSNYYPDYVQYRSCSRRVHDQLNGITRIRKEKNPDSVLPGQLKLFETKVS